MDKGHWYRIYTRGERTNKASSKTNLAHSYNVIETNIIENETDDLQSCITVVPSIVLKCTL